MKSALRKPCTRLFQRSPIKLFGIVCALLIIFSVNSEISAYDGYLMEGTYSLNPENHLQISLYIPGQTLLFDIGEEAVHVASPFEFEGREYLPATTQDGIRALILKKAIRLSNSALNKYDFVINRPIPFCREESSLSRIWMKSRRAFEGEGWSLLWARNAGTILEKLESSYKVSMRFSGGIVEGYLPRERQGVSIEDLGYITLLENGAMPDYQFDDNRHYELCTSCNERILQRNREKLLTEVHGCIKASASISLDPAVAIPTPLKPFVKKILKYLGLEAEIGVDAFIKGEFKKTEEHGVETTLSYGSQGESWQVKSVAVRKAVKSGSEGSYEYHNIGSMLIKKIYTCAGNELDKLDYFYALFTPANNPQNIQKIKLSYDIIKDLGLDKDKRYPALVSIADQSDHYKLVDYFVLEEKIPKGISNYLIKEINLSRPR